MVSGPNQVVLLLVGAVPLLVGVLALRSAWRRYRFVKRVSGANADPVDVGEITPGQTAVEGTARVASETVAAPFTDERGLLSVGETLTPSQSGDGTDSLTSDERAVESVPFTVEDGTGTVAVDAEPGTYHLRAERFDPGDVDQGALEGWTDRTGVDPGNPNAYRQQLLTPGEDVYVFGEASAAGPDAKRRSPDADWQLRAGAEDIIVSTQGRAELGGSNLVVAVILFVLGGTFTLMGLLFWTGLL